MYVQWTKRRTHIRRNSKWCFNEGVDNRKGCPLSLATFNPVMTWSYAIIFVCMCRERFGQTEDYDISISNFSHELSRWAYRQSVFTNYRSPCVRQSMVPISNVTAKLFKDAFFLCFPITLTAFFQDTIEFSLTFFYSWNEILFMGDTEITTTSVSWSGCKGEKVVEVLRFDIEFERADASTWAWAKR